ncbi:hypothetical protein [Mycolicibacterium smegmatis]|uniref:ScoMcrA-like DNA sulfur-binding domain-containing protein n=2 Tax=Mycolicibacterium smegmatis (strain ATCC 700084 / mc(2)155) TaxID=246196 RepID=I7G541_MYCS2|nr:hypothetical protein [Mycolicibacterium smegmatis]AFP37689.1 hypothetical protein MSMEI_1213 [Mycolicibacterium smegmatis MC2 155]AIU06493.1 hypothetical protein LJ00_06220 [Mycolicibacterium smegmatis MC2 155]AIU13118.1 hypothetical protein LI99_06220 [Mycolicibacterium smegmatis]AIU19742.1 hypothetical protein LI98_06220 [Mycolicibacterium smegmatis]MBE9622040.1 hypothetical protein [Mycolicibacterium smegmatis]
MHEPSELLAALQEFRVDIHEGRRVPYKYVTLLWAIARARRTGQRTYEFREVSRELAAVLRPFQVSTSRPDPRNPWFALKESPMWWELTLPATNLTYKQVRELNLRGGLSLDAFEHVVANADFVSRTVQAIIEIIGDSTHMHDLLGSLGLDGAAEPVSAPATIRRIPVEANLSERFSIDYKKLSVEDRTRKEAELQRDYANYLNSKGHTTCRHEISVDGQRLYTDLYDETTCELIEVKSSNDRDTMRLALGQILDYAEVVKPKRMTVVVPSRPSYGITNLFYRHGVRAVWRCESDFESSLIQEAD